MAPELFEGKEADPRSDIFAFGCLLYEMVTGRHAFTGVNSREVISAIVRSPTSPATAIGGEVPATLSRVLEQCLAKDPEERWQCARDLRSELQWIQRSPAGAAAPPVARRAAIWTLVVLSAALATALLASILWRKAKPAEEIHPPVRFSIVLTGNESLGEYLGSSVTFSQDGRRVAYVVNHGAERSIYVRSLDALEGAPVTGTERGSGPFFSPDGEWIGFVADGKLMKVPVSGGQPQTLCSVAVMAGATWGPDETIVYTPIFNGGLFVISASGGVPRRLTKPDDGQFHLYPEILPGGREVLFTVWTEGLDRSRIAVLSLDTGKWRTVFEGAWFARYGPDGHLFYMRGNTLRAVPFDWKQLRALGPSLSVAEGILTNLPVGAAYFDVSHTGSLVYVSGTPQPPQRSLVWVDRSGRRSVITTTRRPYTSPRLSPDGRQVALWLEGDTVNIWTYDLARDALTRLTFSADDHTPVWSPDGKLVAFESSRSGPHHLYVQPADGTGGATQVTTGEYDDYVGDWSPDGHYLVYGEWNPQTGSDLWTVETGGRSPPKPFAKTGFSEKQASFSPDGRWLAYVSDESGQNEVYVQPFPGPGAKRQVSTGGGEEPAWARSGRELFYRLGGRMMAVAVHENGEFTADRPKLLFEGLFHYAVTPSRTYDVGPDGRFLMVAEPEPEHAARQINVVLNWPGQLVEPQR